MADRDDSAPSEPSELDRAADMLERLAGDPMAGAVRGRVTILAVSEPAPRPRYQECRVEMRAEASGVETATVVTDVVFSRRRWPRAGMVLPARVSVTVPTTCEVVWEAMPA